MFTGPKMRRSAILSSQISSQTASKFTILHYKLILANIQLQIQAEMTIVELKNLPLLTRPRNSDDASQ